MEIARSVHYIPVIVSPCSTIDRIVDIKLQSRLLNERLNRDHRVEGIIEKVPGVYQLSIVQL